MYFSNFPKIYYEFDIGKDVILKPITDITANVRMRKEILNNITVYDLYDIQDGETPEVLADKIYGSSQYHWIIMLANDRYDYIRDWPMQSDVLENYIMSKYTMEQLGDTHHWEKDGLIVDSNTYQAYSVSNWDYEIRQNDLKRRIKLIDRGLINIILKDFGSAI